MHIGLTVVGLMIHQSDLSAQVQFSRSQFASGLEYRTEKGCSSNSPIKSFYDPISTAGLWFSLK